jgi:hypothetical protein
VNGRQSKCLDGTWRISQNQLHAPLFYLNQDYVAIGKLLALGTRLGNLESQRKHESIMARTRAKIWR